MPLFDIPKLAEEKIVEMLKTIAREHGVAPTEVKALLQIEPDGKIGVYPHAKGNYQEMKRIIELL